MPDAGSHPDATPTDTRTDHVTCNNTRVKPYLAPLPAATNARPHAFSALPDPIVTDLLAETHERPAPNNTRVKPTAATEHSAPSPRPWYLDGAPLPTVETSGKLTPRAGFEGCFFNDHDLPKLDAYGESVRAADDLQARADEHRILCFGISRYLRAFPPRLRNALLDADPTLEDAAAQHGILRPRIRKTHGKRVGQRDARRRLRALEARLPGELVGVVEITADPADVAFLDDVCSAVRLRIKTYRPTRRAVANALTTIGAQVLQDGARFAGVRLLTE